MSKSQAIHSDILTPLGAEDRVLLALHEVGFPRPMTFVLTYPSAATAPTLAHLSKRIQYLLDHYPMLNVRLEGGGKAACWRPRRSLPSTPPIGDFVAQHTYTDTQDETPSHTVLMEAFRAMERVDIHQGPLWQVRWYSSEKSDKVYITLAGNHTLMDGGGLVNLFKLLMEQDQPKGKEELGSTAGVDEALPFVVPEGVLPEEPALWPQRSKPAAEVPDGFNWTGVSNNILPKLKEQARKRGVQGLNSILETAFLVSLWRVVGESDMTLSTSTMRNERPDAGAGTRGAEVPMWSGNFFSGPSTVEAFSPHTDFWETVASRSKLVHDLEEIAKGRSSLAPLFNMPMPLADALKGKAQSPHPFIASVFFSNITWLDLPNGAEDFDWISSANPNLCAVLAHFVGTQSGLKLSMSFRDGAGLNRDQASRVAALWRVVILKVAEGYDGNFADLAPES